MSITTIEIIEQIRNNKTGEIQECKSTSYLNDDGITISYFNWAEGNYSCDCNRELAFLRAKGEQPKVDSVKCMEGKFSINLIDTRNSEVFYKEF